MWYRETDFKYNFFWHIIAIILKFSNKKSAWFEFNLFTVNSDHLKMFTLKIRNYYMCTVWTNEFPSVMNHVKENG